ncbi:unnamed protein product [Lactuca virosa]|uniref:Uncharacterized protein n=1 Tax=Lactuca virosa TaxID=75947 RepID=A0AAU9NCU9_9ASTR|nr:unnamed protein product [Lactuca virosa]
MPVISKGVMKKTKPTKESLIPHTSNKQVELEKMPLVMKRMYRRLMNREAHDDAIYVEAEPGILGAQKLKRTFYPEGFYVCLNKMGLILVSNLVSIMLHSMFETRGGNKSEQMCFHFPERDSGTDMRVKSRGCWYILDSQKNPDEKLVENYIVVKYVEEDVARLKEDIDTTHPMNWTLVKQPRITKSMPVISKGVMKKTKPTKESLIPHTSNKQVELEKMPLVMKRMYRRLMNREAHDDAIYVEAEPGILGAQKIETMLHSMFETRGGNKVNKCAFISPSVIQEPICESNREGVVSYIVDAMRFHKDK